jgi:hypothetical protein
MHWKASTRRQRHRLLRARLFAGEFATVTTSPIPVEQFGNWLGELATALQTLGDEIAGAETPTSQPSPFQPGPARFLNTIAQGFHGSNRTTSRPLHVTDSHAARAASQLRDQIIHNLGST